MKNRRKRHFIDSAVQGALARRIMLHWIIFSVLVLTIMPFCQIISDLKLDVPFSQQFQVKWMEMAPMFVIMLATLPIFVYDTIRFSHRFAGPIFRFHGVVKRLAAGKQVEPVELRPGDAWKEFADDFNAMVQRLTSEDNQKTSASAENGVNGATSDIDAEFTLS